MTRPSPPRNPGPRGNAEDSPFAGSAAREHMFRESMDEVTATAPRRNSLSSVTSVEVSKHNSGFSKLLQHFKRGKTDNPDDHPWQQENLRRQKAAQFHKALSRCFQWHRFDLLRLTKTFLPSIVINAVEADVWSSVQQNDAILDKHNGCVMKVSCNGFLAMISQLEQHSNGAILLSKCLNMFFTPLIDIVLAYRGDVVRFNGSAFIVFFEAVDACGSFRSPCGSLHCDHSPVELACLRAAACSLELHKRIRHLDLGEGSGHLTLHIGMGAGTMFFIGVKGSPCVYASSSNEQTVAGPPLDQALAAEHLAGPCETVLSPLAWKHIEGTAIEGPKVKQQPTFRRLTAFDISKHTYPMVRHAAQQSQAPPTAAGRVGDPDSAEIQARLRMMIRFLPHSVMRQAWAGTLDNVNEMRTISVAFVTTKGIDPSTMEGASAAARLVFSLQQCSYEEEGYMAKFLFAEDGMWLQFGFGLAPLTHTDDPVRACRACSKMVQHISALGHVGHAGVATGRVFCGLVGSSRRQEYIVMGDVVQLAKELCSEARASAVLVDQVTQSSCEDYVRFAPLAPAKSWFAKQPAPRFELLPPDVYPIPFSFRKSSGSSKQAPEFSSREKTPAPPPPPVPPWLAGPADGHPGYSPDQHLRMKRLPLPTLWTHVCAERPPPRPASEAGGPRGEEPGDGKAWRQHVRVPVPWPARSTSCGGVSPLPNFTCWRHLKEALEHVDACMAQGGGMVILAGPCGCGKTELTEHLVSQSVHGNSRMQPIFGAMEMRAGQEWAALFGALCGALLLLEPAGEVQSEEEFRALLKREATSPHEEAALEQIGLLDGVNASTPSSYSHGVNMTTRTVKSTSSLLTPETGSVTSGAASNNSDAHRNPGSMLAAMVVRLVDRLLGRGGVVVALRVSQGTSLLEVETSHFWALALALGDLATQRRASKHTLLVLVTCQTQHVSPDVASQHPTVVLTPFGRGEVRRYMRLCLGFDGDGDDDADSDEREDACEVRCALLSSESDGEPGMLTDTGADAKDVPVQLVSWLSRIANSPRHVEEGLTQLRREGAIAVAGGKCSLRADLGTLSLAKWVHTRMIGRIISQLEVMLPEMQHVLQMASTISGPFSSLDLAATNRLYLKKGTPNMIAMYQCSKRLVACGELVRNGFLQRADSKAFGWCSGDDCMPWWEISSVLMHEAIASTVLQGTRLRMKRAILLSRASMEHRERLKGLPGESAVLAKARRQRRQKISNRQQSAGAFHDDVVDERQYSSFPASCIVTSSTMAESCEQPLTRSMDNSILRSRDTSDAILTDSEFVVRLTDPAPAHQSEGAPEARRLPLRELYHIAAFMILMVVLLLPDLWIVVEGRQEDLDALLTVAMGLFSLDIISNLLMDARYFRKFFILDVIILVTVLFDVSWALGRHHEDLDIQRKSSASVWRIIGAWVKLAACAGRLSKLTQYVTKLLQGGCARQRGTQDRGRAEKGNCEGSKFLENMIEKLSQTILVSMVIFTVLTILSLQLIDVFMPPREDTSMQAWVQLVDLHLANNSTAAPGGPSMLAKELHQFEQFYEAMSYGPFHVCKGASAGRDLDDFHCHDVLWDASDDGDGFSQPGRQSFQLDVESTNVQALFDFSYPAKHEAWIRMTIIVLTVLCMVGVAVSLDRVVAKLVVAPHARLLLSVRKALLQMHELFPTIYYRTIGEDEHDEVAAFEQVVTKMTLMVTLRNPTNTELNSGSEWIGGSPRHDSPAARELSVYTPKFGETPDNAVVLNIERLEVIGVPYEDVNSWSFDVLTLEKPQLKGVTGWILINNVDPQQAVDPHTIANFLDACAQEYREDNPYHNWKHAVDVHHTVFRECTLSNFLEYATRLEMFALLIAAISHDLAHPGVNNQFLIQTSHEFALRYNDVSPLENMHCSALFRILHAKPEANIFKSLRNELRREVRRICIETILHTDIMHHFEMMKELQMFYHANSDILDQSEAGGAFPGAEKLEVLQQEKTRKLVFSVLLHSADISNTCKPWKICCPWADLVLGEFFLQGDQEKALGLPVQALNDRNKVNKPSSQVAFIEIFVAPFILAQVRIFSPIWEMSEFCNQNLQKWHTLRSADTSMPSDKAQEAAKRVEGICDELMEVTEHAKARAAL